MCMILHLLLLKDICHLAAHIQASNIFFFYIILSPGCVIEEYNLVSSANILILQLILSGKSLIYIKGGYLDFSHLNELKNIYITEIYMKKQYKSSITKNKKIKIKHFDGIPLKGYVAS